MSQGLGIYINTLLLPRGRSQLLQRRDRVFACRSSNLGSIPSWDRLKYFRYMTFATLHSLMKDINLIDSCQAHLPV